jgi:hypothetical protein
MFHVRVWNPPPFCSDYKIGWVDMCSKWDFLFNLLFHLCGSAASNHDPWNGLATLMTLLETVVDSNKDYLSLEGGKGEWDWGNKWKNSRGISYQNRSLNLDIKRSASWELFFCAAEASVRCADKPIRSVAVIDRAAAKKKVSRCFSKPYFPASVFSA